MRVEVCNNIKDVLDDLYECGKLSEDDYNNLFRWINKANRAEKYRWHDLKEDPNDLPTAERLVIILHKDGYLVSMRCREFDTIYGGYTGPVKWDLPMYSNQADVRAWRYIEPFEEEG